MACVGGGAHAAFFSCRRHVGWLPGSGWVGSAGMERMRMPDFFVACRCPGKAVFFLTNLLHAQLELALKFKFGTTLRSK